MTLFAVAHAAQSIILALRALWIARQVGVCGTCIGWTTSVINNVTDGAGKKRERGVINAESQKVEVHEGFLPALKE